jgi:hypothetical protein
MPVIQKDWDDRSVNEFIIEQLAYDTEKECFLADENIALLNNDQRSAFDQISEAICCENGCGFFLHGPGGTGKTFVYGMLCHSVRCNTWITLCVASSGIVALLPRGHTAHLTFFIPIQFLDKNLSCAVNKKKQKSGHVSCRSSYHLGRSSHTTQVLIFMSFSNLMFNHHNECFPGSLSKPSTACFRTSIPTLIHLGAFGLFLAATFNKLCPSYREGHVLT